MSLINQMLKDMKRRDGQSSPAVTVRSTLKTRQDDKFQDPVMVNPYAMAKSPSRRMVGKASQPMTNSKRLAAMILLGFGMATTVHFGVKKHPEVLQFAIKNDPVYQAGVLVYNMGYGLYQPDKRLANKLPSRNTVALPLSQTARRGGDGGTPTGSSPQNAALAFAPAASEALPDSTTQAYAEPSNWMPDGFSGPKLAPKAPAYVPSTPAPSRANKASVSMDRVSESDANKASVSMDRVSESDANTSSLEARLNAMAAEKMGEAIPESVGGAFDSIFDALSLDPSPHSTSAERYRDVPLEAVVAAAEETPMTVAEPGTLVKSDRTLYQDIQAIMDEANRLAVTGQAQTAEKLLFDQLQRYPKSVQLRSYLATLYLQSGQYDNAEQLIRVGRYLVPDATAFTRLLAQTFAVQNDLRTAIALLLENPPAILQEPEHYATLAALYQKDGRHDLAIQLYWDLVELYPDSGKWWAGLGISLEASKADQMALDSYMRSLSATGLSPELRTFVNERVKSLSRRDDLTVHSKTPIRPG